MKVRILILVLFAIGMLFTPFVQGESEDFLEKPVQESQNAQMQDQKESSKA